MSSIYYNLANAIKTTLSADASLDALVETFDITETDLQGLIDNIHSTRIDPDKLPCIFIRVLESAAPDRFTTNEELYDIPVELYTLVRKSDFAAAYTALEAIITLLEPLIRKQKGATYNFGHTAYSNGATTNYPYDRINVNDTHYCIAVTKFTAMKIYSFS